jgi:hypothetical protein
MGVNFPSMPRYALRPMIERDWSACPVIVPGPSSGKPCPPLFAVPAGTSAVPRHGPFQTRGPSCRVLASRVLRLFPPHAYQGGRRPRVPPPRHSPIR